MRVRACVRVRLCFAVRSSLVSRRSRAINAGAGRLLVVPAARNTQYLAIDRRCMLIATQMHSACVCAQMAVVVCCGHGGHEALAQVKIAVF